MNTAEKFNLATWLLDRQVQEGRGDRPAVRFGDSCLTYAEVLDLSNRCGGALRELGADFEKRVLLVLPDGPEFVAAWFGTLKIGAVFAMANTIHPAEDYAYYLDYTRAPVAVVHASVLDRFGPAVERATYLKSILVVADTSSRAGSSQGPGTEGHGGGRAWPSSAPSGIHPGADTQAADRKPQDGQEARGVAHPLGAGCVPAAAPSERTVAGHAGGGRVRVEDFASFVARQSPRLGHADTGPDDLAGWLFTSGSTGHPKAAVHFHQDFKFNIEHYAKQVVGYRESDITLSVPKLFFGYATGTNLMFPFAFGGQTVLFPERATPETLFALIERHRPTVLTSVPTTINGMLQMPGAAKKDLSCLRVCLSAGEALPAELYRRWVETYKVEILDGIGSAEMFHIYISGRFGEVRAGSLGRVVPGYEARIVGPDEQPVPVGEPGALWIKGASRALCYWGSRESSQQTFRGDWCATGDQFRVDADGYFWYEGRADDMLKVSGIFVSPLEIEDCLLKHPAVREVCVVGAEDEGGLTKPKAFVVVAETWSAATRAGAGAALADELKAYVKGKLSPYKYPRWIEFLDALPRNDRGKVQRKVLREKS